MPKAAGSPLARCCDDDAISWADIWRNLAFTMNTECHYSVVPLVLQVPHAWLSSKPAARARFCTRFVHDRQLPMLRASEGMMQLLTKLHRGRASPSSSWRRSCRSSTEWSRRITTLNRRNVHRQHGYGASVDIVSNGFVSTGLHGLSLGTDL